MYGGITNSGEVEVRVHKVKGHCGDRAITPITHQKGNWCADFHAGRAVRKVPAKEAENIQRKDREIWAIQERLIDILYLQEKRLIDPAETTERQPKSTQLDRVAKAGLVTQKVGSHYYCMRCGQSWRPGTAWGSPCTTRTQTLIGPGRCPVGCGYRLARVEPTVHTTCAGIRVSFSAEGVVIMAKRTEESSTWCNLVTNRLGTIRISGGCGVWKGANCQGVSENGPDPTTFLVRASRVSCNRYCTIIRQPAPRRLRTNQYQRIFKERNGRTSCLLTRGMLSHQRTMKNHGIGKN